MSSLSKREHRRALNKSQDSRTLNNSQFGDYHTQAISSPKVNEDRLDIKELAEPIIHHNENLKSYIGRVYTGHNSQNY